MSEQFQEMLDRQAGLGGFGLRSKPRPVLTATQRLEQERQRTEQIIKEFEDQQQRDRDNAEQQEQQRDRDNAEQQGQRTVSWQTSQLNARGKLAQYLVAQYWKIIDKPKFDNLLDAIKNGKQTIDIGNKSIKIPKTTQIRIAAITNPQELNIATFNDLRALSSKEGAFANIFQFTTPNINNDEMYKQLLQTVQNANPKTNIETIIGAALDQITEELSIEEDSQQSASERQINDYALPVIDQDAIDALEPDQRRGVIYILERGTLQDQVNMLEQLQRLPSMTKSETSDFFNRLKRIGNLSKLNVDTNKLYA